MSRETPAISSVLITGASSGIGLACALALDARGWRVFAGVRRAEDADRLRAALSTRATPLILDVTDDAQVAAAAETIAAQVGEHGLQGLVNNAGIALAGPMEYFPPDALQRQLDVNVVGVQRVTRAFLPLVRAGHGRLVQISSISGRFAYPFMGPYVASKFALEAMSDALRRELAPWNIPVILIEPASIRTPIWEKSLRQGDELEASLPPEAHERYDARLRLVRAWAEDAARNGEPVEAVVNAVLHALTAAKPRIRYLVGRRARLLAWVARWLPDRWQDALVQRVFRG